MVLGRIAWFNQAVVASDITAQSTATAASGGWPVVLAKAIQIISIVGGVIWWLYGVYSDITDVDDIANMPSWIFGG